MTDKNITKKEKAIELLKKMDIYKPYIQGFRDSDKVCFFENFGGYWAEQEPELYAKMKSLEKKYNLSCICRFTRIYRIRRALRFPYSYRLSEGMG